MPLCTEIDLGPGHIVLDGTQPPSPPKKENSSPFFSAHVYFDQTVAHLSCCSAVVALVDMTLDRLLAVLFSVVFSVLLKFENTSSIGNLGA